MRRKLIKQGKNALTVTLPSKWVILHQLRARDEIDVDHLGDNLIVSMSSREGFKKGEIRLTSTNPWYVSQILRNAYFSDFEELTVYFDDKELFSEIQEQVSLLLGYEIVSHTEHSCIIKILSKPNESEFSTVLRRVFLLSLSSMDDLYDHFVKGSLDLMTIKKEIFQAKKFCGYGRRLISQKRLFLEEKNRSYYMLLQYFAMIINNFIYLIDYMLSNKISSVSLGTREFVMEVRKICTSLYEKLFKKKIDEVFQVNDMRKELLHVTLPKLFKKSPPNERMILHHLGNCVRLIGSCGGFIFFILNSSNEKPNHNP